MRKITIWLFSTISALVLLFSYRTSTGLAAGPQSGTAPGGTLGGSGSGSGTSTDGSGTGSGGSGGDGTYPGAVVRTRWGPIQVTITVTDHKITNVAVPTYPNGNHRDQEINSYALPLLIQGTLKAQSANVDTISGATVTVDGYRQSLQAAIDSAHLS
jgi:uncharacterized protein with FMN-binding domain